MCIVSADPKRRSSLKRAVHFIVVALLAGSATAQESAPNVEELFEAGRTWVRENVDPDVVQKIEQIDVAKVQKIWREVQTSLQGDYVLDLAPLKPGAAWTATILESQESTRPYGAWLRTRLDYFDVAEQLQVAIPPPPGPQPPVTPPEPQRTNRPPVLVPAPAPRQNPSPVLQRKVWRRELSQRPLPPDGDKYARLLKPVFRAGGVPEELVWMAEVESSFNTTARSPAGAAGLFQFMPTTAKSLGLALAPVDERRDPERSAKAAAIYLKRLYARFHSWPLALAAYNVGEGTVGKLLGNHRGGNFDDIATHLPAETQMYVPKIDATLLRREGKGLDALAPAT